VFIFTHHNAHFDGEHSVVYFAINLLHMFRCVSYGVLPTDEAIKLHEIVQKRKKKNGNITNSTPAKSESATAAKKISKRFKTKSNIDDDVAVDSGMQIGGAEGIGSVVF
jgi:hypothetical protein